MRILILFLITLFPCLANGQKVITGKVMGTDGTTLPFATVYINGTTKGTTSNADGYYRLEVGDTEKELVFRYIGYKTKTVAIENGNTPTVINVSLDLESYSLSEIQIKADSEDPASTSFEKPLQTRREMGTLRSPFHVWPMLKGFND
jgi:hypothetical protein